MSDAQALSPPGEAGGAALAAGARPAPNPWLVALTISLTTFMEVLDISIANVALRHIAGDLAAGQDESTWVLTSYLVSNAIVLPVSGWLATAIGRKRFYMVCVVVFTISSFLCGIAPTLGLLVAFRALQGIGGGGLQPVSQAILADAFTPAQRGIAFAIYGVTVVAAPAIGPTLGGWITDNFSWHWIFFINSPVGIVSLLMTSAFVFDPPELMQQRKDLRQGGLKLDYFGFALIAIGFGFLQVVLDKGEQDDWFNSGFISGASVIVVAALATMVVWELRRKDPIIDLRLLKDRTFLIANILMFMLGAILLGSTVLLPLFVQTLLGYTATQAGLVISPGGFVIMFIMPVVGIMISRTDVRWMIAVGLVVTSLALFHMTRFNLQVDYATVAWARVYQAVGLAFLFVPINAAAFAGIPKAKSNNASAIINMSRNLGGSFGIAGVASILAHRAQYHQTFLAANVTAYDSQYQATVQNLSRIFAEHGASASQALLQAQGVLYGMVQKQASMLAFIDDFRYLGLVFIVLVPFVFLLKKADPGKAAMAH